LNFVAVVETQLNVFINSNIGLYDLSKVFEFKRKREEKALTSLVFDLYDILHG
jgi:hypothetical protein